MLTCFKIVLYVLYLSILLKLYIKEIIVKTIFSFFLCLCLSYKENIIHQENDDVILYCIVAV